jgi:cellulose synthase operon protein YhjQ
MKRVALVGVKGGAGTTTVTANLANALAAGGRRVVVVDLSPGNDLRLHLGMDAHDPAGLAVQVERREPWNEAAFVAASGVHFIPFGAPTQDALTDLCAREPAWLSARISELDLAAEDFVLIDCPLSPMALYQAGTAAAEVVLRVFRPDPLFYAALLLHRQSDGWLIINSFNPSLELDRDMHDLLRAEFRASTSPVTIHRDEHLRRAVAQRESVLDLYPNSQASADFSNLATWLVAAAASG